MEFLAEGSPSAALSEADIDLLLDGLVARLGKPKRTLILPPDITRWHSWAGPLTVLLFKKLERFGRVELLPAIGTHSPMTPEQIERMFPGVPLERFHVHDWRRDLVKLGAVPSEFIHDVSEGKVDYPIDIEVNRLVANGGFDLILSVGQLVPHEVVGIANHSKNVFVGTGGAQTINKTHFLGAAYGMERMMGRARTPVRTVLDYAAMNFARHLPIVYCLTVRGRDESGSIVTRGLFAGDDEACFHRGAELCQQVNLDLLDEPIKKAVVHLDPEEFKSTWLGNKAIYRTRMALADDAELVILAPGVREFGEDPEIDRLIRKFGYHGTPAVLDQVGSHPELAANLSAAAHLIHGSSEGRFRIIYCPGRLSPEEIESVGFEYADLAVMSRRYNPKSLRDGWNDMPDGERIFFISNPGLGLWGTRRRFGRE